ncbi:hypothetical protein QAD02_019120 [Eretmocerus hayati]|uniref:Uncharacterized protein n=1 Tax=Eretmocerus hayati TaxID=131215 RepID=A0ACC2PJY7_9HYME|nr:hypothetical protein QAD02_019120 [Eretmocerus hayati]
MLEKNQYDPSAKDQPILYELLEFFSRKQDPELSKSKNDSVPFPTVGTIRNALRYLNNRYSLPESISQQISFTLPWKLAVGDGGRILAVLQENIIEIRKSKDEYSSIVGRASAPKDNFPQWRKLKWSPDGSILALASSNGYISFYNPFGNNIFNISPKSVPQNPQILEAGDAVAAMIFKKPRVESQTWIYEFIKVNYSGSLKSYCISASEFSENHEFSFGSFYRNGVNSVSYSEKHNLFFVAGNSISQNLMLQCSASQIGLTCWRTLNDDPYYKLSVSHQDNEIYKSHFSIWNFIPVIKSRTQSIIFKSSICPNDKLMACLHTDGTISIWSIPTLKLQNQWKLTEQPEYDVTSSFKTMKPRKYLKSVTEFHPLDIGWWSDSAVIIARYCGSVSVCSITNLENFLGYRPEFLHNHPQIAELGGARGFLCLDCEVTVFSMKRNRDSNSEDQTLDLSSDSEKDEDSKPTTLLNYTTNMMQNAIYSITDIEKFQPKRKRSKVFLKIYRLMGIKSTTPEKLYSRKIEMEEYERALELAEIYNLDPDLVYQTRWRKSEFSIDDINEYLSKVKNKLWVVNECVTRVPETLEATKQLLHFGLQVVDMTEKQESMAVEMNCDFVGGASHKGAETNVIQEGIRNGFFEYLSEDPETIELQKKCMYSRMKLLYYLDHLQVYEVLMESGSKFDKNFYEEFRQLSAFENAVKFAKNCDCRGVEIMFTYYGDQLFLHWLPVISFFPETLDPEKYRKLLPECDLEGNLILLNQKELREVDWVELTMFRDIVFPPQDESEIQDRINSIYESRPSLLPYRNVDFSLDLIQRWYTDRACEIEQESRLVDNALALANIGKSHNISGLESLLFHLETLDDLVYRVGLEDLSLAQIEKLNDLEKIKLLMTKSNEKNFVNDIKCMLLPYARRKKRYLGNDLDRNLLHDYLVFLSKSDLALPVKFFETLKSCDPEILDTIEDIIELAVDCIYASSDLEMYGKAKSIIDAITTYSGGREVDNEEYERLQKELRCLKIFNKYNVNVPLSYVKSCAKSPTEAKDLLVLMSKNLIMLFPFPNEKNWSTLLNDMVETQEQIFGCIDAQTCFEICMSARLKSRLKPAIQGCINLMESKKAEKSHTKVSHERAVDLILEASSDYFNNSKSLTDPDMELARECLNLVLHDDERIKEEYDLIESLKILNEFNINILPVQVRAMTERMKLVQDCLNSRRDAYKNKQKLINLSKYLRIEQKSTRSREGKVLNFIARKAFEMNDYEFCSTTINQMMKNNYHPAWSIALDLACCDDFTDLQLRRDCIWFAISNGPSEKIEYLMKRVNLLQVQILNQDLEKYMPSEDEMAENEEDAGNLDLNLEKRVEPEDEEFMPKIVQTSADLVKSSAQIVKQSTFDLLKSAGSTDFWRSKLNFISANVPEEVVANDQFIEKKRSNLSLKYPCFYETSHPDCGVGNLDTKYARYSQNDCNPKLRLCQTLLRISLLSETASYGAEISDINHLLLECAKHTIPEDCIYGLTYLMSLDVEQMKNIDDLSNEWSENEEYRQILAYFCAIQIYSRSHPDDHDVLSYDPIELIERVMNSTVVDENFQDLKSRIPTLMEKKDEIKPIDPIVDLTEEHLNDDRQDEFDSAIEEAWGISSINVDKVNESSTSDYILSPKYTDTEKSGGDADDGWGDWGDEWNEVSKIIDAEKNSSGGVTISPDSAQDNESEEIPLDFFREKFAKIRTIDEYKVVKNMLFECANVDTMDPSSFDPNLILQMIANVANLDNESNHIQDEVLQEFKDLLQRKLVPQDMLIGFILEKKDSFTGEQYVYLQLCSKDISLQQEAIDHIKSNHKDLNLTLLILEEIFFNNLTSFFNVSHELYYRILEGVFTNRTIAEIEDYVKLLIENLVEQRNIPHAIALLNQLEGIPSSLSTYESCFKLLLRK